MKIKRISHEQILTASTAFWHTGIQGVFLLVLIVLAGCDGVFNVSDTEYVNRAESFIDDGELKSASIELKNALSKNPKNSKARWLLGKLYLDMGHAAGAEKEITRARELGVVDESVLPILTKALLAQKKVEDVLAIQPRGSLSNAATAELLAARGLAYLALDEQENALRELTAALDRNPNSIYALVSKARVFAVKEEFEEAQGYLDKVFSIDNEYVPAWRLQGDIRRFLDQPEDAIEAYSKAINFNKFAPANDLLSRAKLYIQLQHYEEAQQDINELKKHVSDHPDVNYIHGLNLYLQNRVADAQEAFELAIRADSNYMPAVFYLGITHYQQGRTEQAKRYINQFLSANSNHRMARKLLAVLELKEKNYRKVEALVRPIVSFDDTDVLALNLLASALIARGKTEDGIQFLQKIVELDPESSQAKTRLGAGLLMKGEDLAALQNLKAAIELGQKDQNQQADVILSMYYLETQALNQAQEVAENFVQRDPNNPTAHNMLGLVYHGQKKADKARQAFSRALKIAPGDPASSHNLAVLAEKDSNPGQARTYYEDVLKYHPNHLQTLLKVALLEARQENIDSMKDYLERAITAHPQAVEPRVMLARNHMRHGSTNEASGLLRNLDNSQRNTAEVLLVLAEIQLATKDNVSAKNTLEKLLEQRPNYAEGYYLLAKAYMGMSDLNNSKQQLSKTLALNPEHIAARLDQVRLQIVTKEIDQAKENLEILKSMEPENPDVMAIEGFMNIQAGKLKEGLANLQQRYNTNPNTKTLFELIRLKWGVGKRKEALSDLEQWINEHPEDVAARLALAEYYLNVERTSTALAQYEDVLEISENNLVALNNLAWNLRDIDTGKAKAYAEKAYALTPESGATIDTLSSILLATGEIERAQRLNEKALAKKPGSPTFLYRKAQILEASGYKEESLAELKSLLGRNINFPERESAEQMLSQLERSLIEQ